MASNIYTCMYILQCARRTSDESKGATNTFLRHCSKYVHRSADARNHLGRPADLGPRRPVLRVALFVCNGTPARGVGCPARHVVGEDSTQPSSQPESRHERGVGLSHAAVIREAHSLMAPTWQPTYARRHWPSARAYLLLAGLQQARLFQTRSRAATSSAWLPTVGDTRARSGLISEAHPAAIESYVEHVPRHVARRREGAASATDMRSFRCRFPLSRDACRRT